MQIAKSMFVCLFTVSAFFLIGLRCSFVEGARRTEAVTLRRRVFGREQLRSLLPSPRVKRLPIRPQQTISGHIVPLESVGPPAKYVRKPRKKQLASAQLRKLLGDFFDEEWMSETKPDVLIIEPTEEDYEESFESKRLYRELTRLNISSDLKDALGSEDPTGQLAKSVESWLVRRSLCPIRFVWEEVGPLFWPPWIKRGECVDDFRRSCSWPPGMHCMPSEVRAVHLLRWHCRPHGIRERRSNDEENETTQDTPTAQPTSSTELPVANDTDSVIVAADNVTTSHTQTEVVPSIIRRRQPAKRRTRVRCQWLRVPYPVTSSCYCSC